MSDAARIDVADLKSRVDLVALAESRGVELRRAGHESTGLCPFHGEKTPSLFIDSEKGLFHCFGCGAGGDAVTFVMLCDNIPFKEAVALLAGTRSAAPRSATRRAVAPPTRPGLVAKTLWDRLPFRDEIGVNYLAERRILPSPIPSDVIRFNVGASGNSWLDARAREGYRVAFAARDGVGTVQNISLRHALPGKPPRRKTLVLMGCPTKGAAICSPEIQLLAGAEPEFARDEVLLVEGGTSWLGASLFFAEAIGNESIRPIWPLGVIGASNAASVVEAFAPIIRWRVLLLGFDADAAGERAIVAAAETARRVGAREIGRICPPTGKDWAEAVALERAS